MTGKPQRSRAKADVKLEVEESAYERVLTLMRGTEPRVSLSRLIEAILLLAKNEYVSNRNKDFVAGLCLMKRQQIEEVVALRGKGRKRRIHVTIDREALEFLDMLVARNHEVFHARGDAMTLMLRQVGDRLTSGEKIAWMQRRLEEIMLKYPVRY